MATKHTNPEVRERELLRPLGEELAECLADTDLVQQAEVLEVDGSDPKQDVIRIRVLPQKPADHIELNIEVGDFPDAYES